MAHLDLDRHNGADQHPSMTMPCDLTPPFDEDELDEGPSENIIAILADTAEMGFSCVDFLELALCCIEEICADLTDGLSPEEIGAEPLIVAALERLNCGTQILGAIDFGDDDGEADEEADEEDLPMAA